MRTRGPKRGSGPRSNAYSESKFTNWQRYNPFDLEACALPADLKPDRVVQVSEHISIPIYVSRLHPAFLRPCLAEDVSRVLLQVPAEYLAGLEGVFLLGGTAKQDVSACGRLGRYGGYERGRIYLHAFPRQCMTMWWRRMPKPSIEQEYRLAGAEIFRDKDRWAVRFTAESLRRYFLYDVLLHEIGHHVDGNLGGKNIRTAERYAVWFANQRRKRMAGQRA